MRLPLWIPAVVVALFALLGSVYTVS